MKEGSSIQGDAGIFIRFASEVVYGFPETPGPWSGYDVRVNLEIKSSGFQVKATMWTSTGEISELYQQLRQCNESIAGNATYASCEGNLELTAQHDNMGHVTIRGEFSEQNEYRNILNFEFQSDQIYVQTTIHQLDQIIRKYGNTKGITK